MDDESLDSDDDWEDWCDDDSAIEEALCLFCGEKFRSIDALVNHLNRSHGFNLNKIAGRLSQIHSRKFRNK